MPSDGQQTDDSPTGDRGTSLVLWCTSFLFFVCKQNKETALSRLKVKGKEFLAMKNSNNEGEIAQDQPSSRQQKRVALLLVCTSLLAFLYLRISPSLSVDQAKSDTLRGFPKGNNKNLSWEKTGTPSETSKKPNILFIMTDQQRFDAIRRVQDELDHYKNVTKIRTPNLDKLSRDGAYFRNAYTQSSVCGPARGSLRTGCTIERTGLQTNELMKTHIKSPWFANRVKELKVIDQVLTEHGYISEYYGKWHLPDEFWKFMKYNNYDHSKQGFTLERKDKSNILRNYKRFLSVYEKRGDISRKLQEGMQLDPWDDLPYTPIEVDSRFDSPTGTVLTEENGFKEMDVRQPSASGVAALESKYSNSYFIADASSKALKRLKKQDKPFILTVSFVAPHPPMIAFSDYWEYYRGRKDSLYVSHNYLDTMNNSAYDVIADEEPKYRNYTIIQEWTSVYYAMIEEVDALVGDILKELGDEKDNTLIVYTSDHGESLGAHGRREKNTFYEEANKVPLFISFPPAIDRHTVVDEPVSHIDVVATILDYAGLSDYDDSDGSSLRSKIEKQSYNKVYDENAVVAEYDFRDIQGSQSAGAPILNKRLQKYLAFMVRKDQYKLMMRKDSQSQKMDMMFNLNKDPFEMNNLLGSNAETATVKTMEKAEHLRCLLLDWMHRMDGGDKKYYSDPAANGGDGLGDIEEVRLRQSWPALDFWKSDSRIEMGQPVWNGAHYVRNEYLYFGTRMPGQKLVQRLRLSGEDASLFRLELADKNDIEEIRLHEKECVRVKVSFATRKLESRKYRAAIKLQVTNGLEGEPLEHVIAVRVQNDLSR